MFSKYYKVAIRSLLKNRIFSAINIAGLAVGLTCFLLIMAYLVEELSYDRYPAHAADIYRMGVRLDQNGGVGDYPDVDGGVGEGVKAASPLVLASTRIAPDKISFLRKGDKLVRETGFAICDSNFLQVFSIALVEGDARTALTEPNSVVITRAFEQKYFDGEPALGKTLRGNMISYKVTGVIDKVPERSHFHYDAFVSMTTYASLAHNHTWSNIGQYTYLLLRPGADPKDVEKLFPGLAEKYVAPEAAHDMGISLADALKGMSTWHFYLMPLTDVHLRSHTKYELEPGGDLQYIYIFAALAVFILLLACVNFTNLSTASSVRRSREVGIRKVLGSVRQQLVLQFLTESVLLTLGAMLLALGLVHLLLPWFNQVSGKHISFAWFTDYRAVLIEAGLVLLVGLLAGGYPSFFLSSFKILAVLKGSGASAPSGRSALRSSLVVFQFVISTSMIMATLIVYSQLYFMQHKQLGYDKEQVIYIQDAFGLGNNQYAFKEQLLKDSRISSVTISRDAPVDRDGADVDGTEVFPKEKKANEGASEIHSYLFHVDYDYIKTLGMAVVAGRNLSRDFRGDSAAVVINEAAVRDLGYKNDPDALNRVIVGSGMQEWKVVGVVKDFNYTSVRQKIAPLMMMLGNNGGGVMVKIGTADVKGVIGAIRQAWTAFNPQTPFTYYFLDDRFAALYAQEQKTGEIFSVFAALAILIASLGLFGLVAFTTEQRAKEIGIRKVLGASVAQVTVLLSKNLLGLVVIAMAIAIPLTGIAMHWWLENFAYRTGIRWWIFVLAGSAALLIAIATISFRSIKAALTNPVKSLRSE
jgi:putative ABC transport system permease protein